jgi:NhaP-type Na+/H+ and K+/H+ antiporter
MTHTTDLGAITQNEIIDDAITLVANMVANESGGLVHKYDKNTGALRVSFTVFQWSLSVAVTITDKQQIARMEKAINHNVNVLQLALSDYHLASKALTAALFHGCDAIKRTYKTFLGNANGSYVAYEEFKEQYLTPLQNDYELKQSRIFQGECKLHPNRYLQSLGVKHLRLDAVSPSYR